MDENNYIPSEKVKILLDSIDILEGVKSVLEPYRTDFVHDIPDLHNLIERIKNKTGFFIIEEMKN